VSITLQQKFNEVAHSGTLKLDPFWKHGYRQEVRIRRAEAPLAGKQQQEKTDEVRLRSRPQFVLILI
jgi:hypothetical protein